MPFHGKKNFHENKNGGGKRHGNGQQRPGVSFTPLSNGAVVRPDKQQFKPWSGLNGKHDWANTPILRMNLGSLLGAIVAFGEELTESPGYDGTYDAIFEKINNVSEKCYALFTSDDANRKYLSGVILYLRNLVNVAKKSVYLIRRDTQLMPQQKNDTIAQCVNGVRELAKKLLFTVDMTDYELLTLLFKMTHHVRSPLSRTKCDWQQVRAPHEDGLYAGDAETHPHAAHIFLVILVEAIVARFDAASEFYTGMPNHEIVMNAFNRFAEEFRQIQGLLAKVAGGRVMTIFEEYHNSLAVLHRARQEKRRSNHTGTSGTYASNQMSGSDDDEYDEYDDQDSQVIDNGAQDPDQELDVDGDEYNGQAAAAIDYADLVTAAANQPNQKPSVQVSRTM